MPTQRRARKSDEARPAKSAAKRKAAPEAARAPRGSPAGSRAASHEQLLQLNSRVGNRAVARMVSEPAAEQPAEPTASAVQRRSDEAPAVGLEGGEAGEQIEARLAANTGGGRPLPEQTRAQMERGIGADFSAVRVHTGPESQTLNRQLGAQAFTHGSDIFMAEGKYAPSSSDGQQLLAHELTHVVQQGASPVQRAQPAEPNVERDAHGVIRRKLAGTGEALAALGGAPSKKSLAKARLAQVKGKFGQSTTEEGSGKYAQIVLGLKSYEKQEAKLLGLNQNFLGEKNKADLWGRLKEIELTIVAWLEDNAELEADPEAAKRLLDRTDSDEIMSAESEAQKRFHALRILLPRLRHEQMEIARDDFYRTQSFSDRRLDAANTRNDAFGGQVNRLDVVSHRGTERQGVFIEDKTWSDAKTVGSSMGITVADPNAGARSVAMYQLSQLLALGVNVIARTEFATHTSATHKRNSPLAAPMAKMGVRMEMAEGREAAQTPIAMTDEAARDQGGGAVSLEDPRLQRSLNALQLIDAIAGQVDRHWHNYYVAADEDGRVEGVVGIDLDMAFAPDHRTVAPATNDAADPLKGSHFVGLPKIVDSEFARRIRLVEPARVEALLKVYLKPSEVAATLERYNLVREFCIGVLQRREAIQPGGWGAATARRQLEDENAAGTSYLGKLAGGVTKHDFATPAVEQTAVSVRDNTDRRTIGQLIDSLERFIWVNKVTSAESMRIVQAILANYTARPDIEQRPLLAALGTTPVANWNNLLTNPAAEDAVLARCV